MSLLTKRLAMQSLSHLSLEAAKTRIMEQQSLESELLELQEGVDTGIDQLQETADGFTGQAEEIQRTEAGTDSLAGLVENTIAVYGEHGITEDGAKALEVSVESLLRSMGVSDLVKLSVVLPTFEGKSRVQYSTEAEEKKEGVVARLWEWLKGLYAKLAEFATSVIDKLRVNVTAVQAYSKRVSDAVDKATATTPTSKLKLGGDGAFTRNGAASEAVSETANSYSAFVKSWSTQWDSLIKVDPTSSTMSGALDAVTGVSTKMPSEKDFKFTPFHTLELTPGQGENVIVGAKAKVVAAKAESTTEFDCLNQSQMKATITAVNATLVDLVTAQEQITKWNGNLKRISTLGNVSSKVGWMNSKVGDESAKASGAEMRKVGQALNSAARLAMDGFSQTFTPTLKVLRSNLIYVAKSASAHTNSAAAEKPAEPAATEKPDDKKE